MKAKDVVSTRMKRRLERRELRLYETMGFVLCLPLVALARAADLLRGRGAEHQGTIIEETNAKVGAMLGFVFMA